MRFSAALAVCAAAFAIAAPTPADDSSLMDSAKQEVGKTGPEIAACETKVAQEEVSCINACGKDGACITNCSTKAAAEYVACAS